MKNSTRYEIVKYLETEHNNSFVFAGTIARKIHEMTGTKESQVERRLREMTNDGVLEKIYSSVNGKGRFVCYKQKCYD